MSDIVDAIQKAAQEGRLAHLQVAPSDNEFVASFREKGEKGYRIAHAPDPATALRQVLGL